MRFSQGLSVDGGFPEWGDYCWFTESGGGGGVACMVLPGGSVARAGVGREAEMCCTSGYS